MGLLSFLQGWGNGMNQPMQQNFMPGEWDWMKQSQQWGQWPGGQMAQPQGDLRTNSPLLTQPNEALMEHKPPPPGMGERVGAFFNPQNQQGIFGPGMMKAFTLIGEGQNGGDWGRAMDRISGIDKDQAQAASQRFQQQVQMRQMQRQEGDWKLQDDQVGRWQAAVEGEKDPARKSQLLAIGPEGYAQYINADRALQAEQQARQTQMEFTARENALDRSSRFAVAGMGRDPLDTAVGRMAAARVGSMQEASLLAQQSAIPRIQRMKALLAELGALNGVHNPVGAEGQRLIGRLTGGGGRANQIRDEMKNITGMMTLDYAEKLKPMSNSDITTIQQMLANPDMTLTGAMAILDNQEAELKRGVQTAGEAARWFDQNRGLGPNSQGMTFEEYVAGKYPAPEPPPDVPEKGDVRAGWRFMGGDPSDQRNWVKVNSGAPSRPRDILQIINDPFNRAGQ